MPLLRGVARVAVISGTATAVSNNVSRRQANKWAAQDESQAQAQASRRPGGRGGRCPRGAELGGGHNDLPGSRGQ